MTEEPKTKPPPARKRPQWVALLVAGIGIVLLNEAADSVHFHPVNLLVVVQIAIGLGCFVFAGLCAAKRI